MKGRDKFLTEAMGECWHNWSGDEYDITCLKCGSPMSRPDFSTWEGFGKLWEWSEKQEWYFDFIGYCQDELETIWVFEITKSLIHPDRFANALYEFLKERQ